MPRKAQFPPPIHQHRTKAEKAAGRPGRARVRVRGEDVWLGPYGSPEAEAAYKRLVAQLGQPGGGLPAGRLSDPTVDEVVSAFLAAAKEDYDPKGREYEQFVYSTRPLLALYGPTPAREFDALALEAVQRAMADGSWAGEAERDRRHPAAWCRNVVNRRVTRIRTLWKWAERKKLVPPGSAGHLATLPGLRKGDRRVRHTAERVAADLAQTRAVAAHCPQPVATMLELQALAGMRSAEVRLMRAGDVDTAGEVWTYTPPRDKNAWRDGQAPRVVPLGPECQRLLGTWLRPGMAADLHLFRPRGGANRPYSDTTYAQAVARACKRAGVKLVPYSGRHGAKRRITRELGADAARAVLGHKTISTTAHYGGLDAEHAREVAKKVG